MGLNNRTFKDNRTGEILKVVDSFENIAYLENKTKIDSRRLMDTNYFTEQVDPKSFFNNQNAYDSLFEKIKTIPADRIPDENGEITPNVGRDNGYMPPMEEESAVIYGNIDDEREELAKKYGAGLDTKSLSKQNEAFTRILGEDSDEANDLPSIPESQPMLPITFQDEVQRVNVDRETTSIKSIEKSASEVVVDPIVIMFKGVKRSVEFNLDLKLENKIPRLEFIELMEDSYEKSIIEFLADEFTNELLKDPKALKERISNKIREMVYERDAKKTIVKRAPAKKPILKKSDVLEKKLVSKTIAKKEIEEK